MSGLYSIADASLVRLYNAKVRHSQTYIVVVVELQYRSVSKSPSLVLLQFSRPPPCRWCHHYIEGLFGEKRCARTTAGHRKSHNNCLRHKRNDCHRQIVHIWLIHRSINSFTRVGRMAGDLISKYYVLSTLFPKQNFTNCCSCFGEEMFHSTNSKMYACRLSATY